MSSGAHHTVPVYEPHQPQDEVYGPDDAERALGRIRHGITMWGVVSLLMALGLAAGMGAFIISVVTTPLLWILGLGAGIYVMVAASGAKRVVTEPRSSEGLRSVQVQTLVLLALQVLIGPLVWVVSLLLSAAVLGSSAPQLAQLSWLPLTWGGAWLIGALWIFGLKLGTRG